MVTITRLTSSEMETARKKSADCDTSIIFNCYNTLVQTPESEKKNY